MGQIQHMDAARIVRALRQDNRLTGGERRPAAGLDRRAWRSIGGPVHMGAIGRAVHRHTIGRGRVDGCAIGSGLIDRRGRRGGRLATEQQLAHLITQLAAEIDDRQLGRQGRGTAIGVPHLAAAERIAAVCRVQKRAGIEREPCRVKARQHMAELAEEAPALVVGGFGQMRLVTQDIADKGREVRIRPAFDEDPVPILVKLFDRVREADLVDILADGRGVEGVAVCREGLGGRAGIEDRLRLTHLDAFEKAAESIGHRRHVIRVIAPGDRQARTDRPLGQNRLLQGVDLGLLAKQNGLVGAVVHGEMDLREAAHDLFQDRPVEGRDGQEHALGDNIPPGDIVEDLVHPGDHPADGRAVELEEAARHQCRILARRMTEHRMRLDAKGGERRKDRLIGGKDHFRAVIDLVHQPFQRLPLIVANQRGGRVDDILQPGRAAPLRQAGDKAEPVADGGHGKGRLFHHVSVLGHLAGEEEGDLAVDGGSFEIDAVPCLDGRGLRLGERLSRGADLLGQIGRIGGHDGEPRRTLGSRPTGRCGSIEPLRLGHFECVEGCKHSLLVRPGEDENLFGLDRRHGRDESRGRIGLLPDRGLFQHDMGVDAAKTECVDRRAPGMVGAVDPGPGLVCDIEGCGRQAAFLVDLVHQGRRHDLVLEGERHLDDRGRARGRNAVPDHRFDRADGHGRDLALAFAKDMAQRVDLGPLAQGNAGTVRLDQTDGGRVDAAVLIGALDRQHLALVAGRHQARALAVRGLATTLDHRIDPVIRLNRVREALQHDDTRTLAQNGAVGTGVEGADLARSGERTDAAEDCIDQRRGRRVDTPCQHDVGIARPQLVHRQIDSDDRGRTGRIDDVVGAHQVQPVGHPPGHDVGHQARHGIGGDLGQLVLHQIHRRFDPVGSDIGEERLQEVPRLAEKPDLMHAIGIGPVGMDRMTEDHARTAAVEFARGKPRIDQRIMGKFQRQELVGLCARDRKRHGAEGLGIEARKIAQKPALAGVDLAELGRVGVVDIAIAEPGIGRICHRIDLVQDIRPEDVDIISLRINPCHPDDGNVFFVCLGHAPTLSPVLMLRSPPCQPPLRRLRCGEACPRKFSSL